MYTDPMPEYANIMKGFNISSMYTYTYFHSMEPENVDYFLNFSNVNFRHKRQ